ncbi:MAG: flagellar protein FlaG [Methanocella sp.]
MEVEAVGKPYPALAPNQAQAQQGSSPETVDKAIPTAKTEETAKAKADAVTTVLQRAKVDHEQFKAFLDKLNIAVNALDIQARFSVHEATREVMVKVVNVETGKVIREIPPKKILDAVAKMLDMVGLLMDERA